MITQEQKKQLFKLYDILLDHFTPANVRFEDEFGNLLPVDDYGYPILSNEVQQHMIVEYKRNGYELYAELNLNRKLGWIEVNDQPWVIPSKNATGFSVDSWCVIVFNIVNTL